MDWLNKNNDQILDWMDGWKFRLTMDRKLVRWKGVLSLSGLPILLLHCSKFKGSLKHGLSSDPCWHQEPKPVVLKFCISSSAAARVFLLIGKLCSVRASSAQSICSKHWLAKNCCMLQIQRVPLPSLLIPLVIYRPTALLLATISFRLSISFMCK